MTASFLREDGGVSQLRPPASASLLLYELQSYVLQDHPQKRELYTWINLAILEYCRVRLDHGLLGLTASLDRKTPPR